MNDFHCVLKIQYRFSTSNACMLIVHAKSLQSCPTLCNPMECSSPDSSVHGILQARILEWAACPSPRDLPDPGIKPHLLYLLHWQVGSLPLAPPEKPNMSNTCYRKSINFSLWISDKVVAQPCPTLCDHHGLQPARLFCPWNSPGKNIGVDCYYLLQGSS